MPVNSNKPERWKSDIAQSVDFYNDWFMRFAPKAYRDTRVETTKQVMSALKGTDNLTNIGPNALKQNPFVLPILRMATAPPIARDRLVGLADVSPNLVKSMEIDRRIPSRMEESKVDDELQKIGRVIKQLVDKDVFPWLDANGELNQQDIYRAATIVSDRLCGAIADPIIRNAQERRQLASIRKWLEKQGYTFVEAGSKVKFSEMEPGSFVFRLNVPVKQRGRVRKINIPIDVIVMSIQSKPGDFPLLIEAKSAGDFTNTNKRRLRLLSCVAPTVMTCALFYFFVVTSTVDI